MFGLLRSSLGCLIVVLVCVVAVHLCLVWFVCLGCGALSCFSLLRCWFYCGNADVCLISYFFAVYYGVGWLLLCCLFGLLGVVV